MKILCNRTLEFIDGIYSVDFFGRVGHADHWHRRVTSWEAATRRLRSRSWVRLKEKVLNYMDNVAIWPGSRNTADRDRVIAAINEKLTPLATKLWEDILRVAGPESPNVHAEMTIDLRSACVEVEFESRLPIHFFSERVFPVYQSGHLPCGWSGTQVPPAPPELWKPEIPKGEIVVF